MRLFSLFIVALFFCCHSTSKTKSKQAFSCKTYWLPENLEWAKNTPRDGSSWQWGNYITLDSLSNISLVTGGGMEKRNDTIYVTPEAGKEPYCVKLEMNKELKTFDWEGDSVIIFDKIRYKKSTLIFDGGCIWCN